MSTTPNDPIGGQQQPDYTQPPYAQPEYAQPQYAQPPSTPPGPRPGSEKNWMNIASLVLSLAGLITGVSVIAGVIFGHMGVRAAKRGEADNGGLGRAGLIIGYIFIVIGIIIAAAFVAFFGWFASECGGDNPANWCTEAETTAYIGS